jgi:signal peptidase I
MMAGAFTLVGVILSLTVALTWVKRRWMVVTVEGRSMEPTLKDGQRVLARRVHASAAAAPRFGRSDVVVFRLSPAMVEQQGSEDLPLRIKRITAVGGDPLPSWALPQPWASGATHVPPSKVIVEGDNPVSQGSRELGYIDEGAIVAVCSLDASA